MGNIICFIAGELTQQINTAIAKWDTKDYQVQVFHNVADLNVMPSTVLDLLQEQGYTVLGNNHFTFLSDMANLCSLMRRIYCGLFEEIIDLAEESKGLIPTAEYAMPELFEAVIDLPILRQEQEYIERKSQGEPWLVHFQIEDFACVFAPTPGKPVWISKQGISVEIPDKCMIVYDYEFMEQELAITKQMLALGTDEKGQMLCHAYFEQILSNRIKVGEVQFAMYLSALEDYLLRLPGEQVLQKIMGYAFIMELTKAPWLIQELFRITYKSSYLTPENGLYLWRQLIRKGFENPLLNDKEGYADKIYQRAYEYYKDQVMISLSPICIGERDRSCIYVITLNFLGENHAPTKTMLERIYTLGHDLHKKVVVINSREQLTSIGRIPIYGMKQRNLIEKYNDIDCYNYKDYTFPFYQCKGEMPNLEEVNYLLSKIREDKPYMILTIGYASILSDLAANIVPVVNIPVVFTSPMKRDNQYVVLGRPLPETELTRLVNDGYLRESLIESTFTFELKKQNTKLSRTKLHIPEDKFVLLVVGLRLDYDVDYTFIDAMTETFAYGTHIVLAGVFEHYQMWCEKNPEFAAHSTFIGYQEDILAVDELCNLYVNPKRFGGGFSIAEAFSKGVPGVAIAMGDVGATAGEQFCVKDYPQMVKQIIRYIEDEQFYKDQAEAGLKRIQELTDSATELKKVIKKAEEGKLFF